MSEEQLTKKERKELKRQEQAEAQKREAEAARAKKVKTTTIVVIAAVIIAIFIGWLVNNAPERPSLTDETPEAINVVDENDRVKGASSENAKMTIVEYSDFECPACAQYYPIMKQIVETYGADVQFVYRHLPIRHIHPNAELAARYAEAAGEQDMFFAMHDNIFENQGSWAGTSERAARKIFEEIATNLELDMEKLLADVESEEIGAKIEADRIDAIGAGANSTPTFYVDGQLIQNPRSFAEFEALVQSTIGVTPTPELLNTPTLQLQGAQAVTESGEEVTIEVEEAGATN